MQALGIVDQVRTALAPRNRLATAIGSLLGGFVPLGTYMLAHKEIHGFRSFDLMMILVLGGLIYSAGTVYQWGKLAFRSGSKALGFAVLAEGIMTFSGISWLGITALGYLIAINAIATGVTLSQGQSEPTSREAGARTPRVGSSKKPADRTLKARGAKRTVSEPNPGARSRLEVVTGS